MKMGTEKEIGKLKKRYEVLTDSMDNVAESTRVFLEEFDCEMSREIWVDTVAPFCKNNCGDSPVGVTLGDIVNCLIGEQKSAACVCTNCYHEYDAKIILKADKAPPKKKRAKKKAKKKGKKR